ncbi:MAG: DUF99 family protein [Nitrososphaera sp.]|uniref:endonuclease dU n=1 Tax=Nitrososphaera sp. TaxID=1971748 RepID=UPI003D6F6824
MKRVNAEKKGIRVLAIAESFGRHAKQSVLAGVVMRRDLVVDGFVFGLATVEGDDATDAIVAMHRSLYRDDISCIIIDGQVISMYNIIDGQRVAEEAGLPVVAVTFEDSIGLEGAIRHHFPDSWPAKMEQYERIGGREKIVLRTGKALYARCWGLTTRRATALLNAFTLQGALPEPVRVAKTAARAAANAFC